MIVKCNVHTLLQDLEKIKNSESKEFSHKGLFNDMELHILSTESHWVVNRHETSGDYYLFSTVSTAGYRDIYKSNYVARLRVLNIDSVDVEISPKRYVVAIYIFSMVIFAFLIISSMLEGDPIFIIFSFFPVLAAIYYFRHKNRFKNYIHSYIKKFQHEN